MSCVRCNGTGWITVGNKKHRCPGMPKGYKHNQKQIIPTEDTTKVKSTEETVTITTVYDNFQKTLKSQDQTLEAENTTFTSEQAYIIIEMMQPHAGELNSKEYNDFYHDRQKVLDQLSKKEMLDYANNYFGDKELSKFISADNFNYPKLYDTKMLDNISINADKFTLMEIVQHLNVSEKTLVRLAKETTHEQVLLRIVQNPKTPTKILIELSKNTNTLVQGAVARNPRIPQELIEELSYQIENWNVLKGIAANPVTPKDIAVRISDHFQALKLEVAQNNTMMPQWWLDREAKNEDYRVRSAVARNTTTSAKTLASLVNDEDSEVRLHVAENENTPVTALKKLADPSERYASVRATVATHPKVTTEILELLSNDEDSEVRYRVLHNPKTRKNVIEKFLTDKDQTIVTAARNIIEKQ